MVVYMSEIPATGEEEVGGLRSEASPGKKYKILSEKLKSKRTGGMASGRTLV
jgi:hypothetical protein